MAVNVDEMEQKIMADRSPNPEQLVITGGIPLRGEVRISGAKNAALPLLASALLATRPVSFTNVPLIEDVNTMRNILTYLGVQQISDEQIKLEIDASQLSSYTPPQDLVTNMRASILLLGPLLARMGKAEIALPGGCAIGSRPIDLHIKGLEALGAEILIEDGYIKANAPNGLTGGNIVFDTITVTGTENIMMAATLAKGVTVIKNAACEPEIQDLANFLNSIGAQIEGAGTDTIIITGVESLDQEATSYPVLPDRIETATFLIAAAITNGTVLVTDTDPRLLTAVLETLQQAGAEIACGDTWIRLDMDDRQLTGIHMETAPFPGIPTDVQAQFCVLNAVANGTSMIKETIFENRFMHIPELCKMGADISIEENIAIFKGVDSLTGTNVQATDLRAAACLVLAALAARGVTIIDRIHHLDRGYECMEKKLSQLGAIISRQEFKVDSILAPILPLFDLTQFKEKANQLILKDDTTAANEPIKTITPPFCLEAVPQKNAIVI